MCLYASDVHGYHEIAETDHFFLSPKEGENFTNISKFQGNNYSKMWGHWKWDITHWNILDWKKILKVHSRKVSVVGCRKLTCLAIEWIERSPLPKCQNAKTPIQNNLIKKTEAFVALDGKSAGFPLRTISFSRFDSFVLNGQSLFCIHICISSIIIFDYFWFCTFWSRWLDWIGLSPGCMLSFHASAFCTGLLSSLCLYLYLYLSLYFHLRLFLYLC